MGQGVVGGVDNAISGLLQQVGTDDLERLPAREIESSQRGGHDEPRFTERPATWSISSTRPHQVNHPSQFKSMRIKANCGPPHERLCSIFGEQFRILRAEAAPLGELI